MLDFTNVALRTLMCLAFLVWVVRPMLMSMVRREPNYMELEEMAQLAVNSAYRQQFASFQIVADRPKHPRRAHRGTSQHDARHPSQCAVPAHDPGLPGHGSRRRACHFMLQVR